MILQLKDVPNEQPYFKVFIMTIRGHSTTTWTEFCRFLTPPPLRGQFLYPRRGQKQTFFDPLPPHLVHVVNEWPLSDQKMRSLADRVNLPP